ncbi:alpha/beta hydrolase [Candidatus Paraluminiphilus aquimaris]|uniref:Alpha/beta hydrolase n=1 Tax=Candidatus Paraluminiphilus aquimaris TaxID=2518994 RepID=A0ABY6Q6I8_9GAMM|nr:alpha/beta hydrolase [Candidatus Paraluminiphilus aquimaris]UZP74899.1 alpha/beta hydrolase [Candidatus Paraluminiphilus aquimaris]
MRRFSDFYYQVPHGLTLYARDYTGPDDRAGCVLLMHGLTRNSRDFDVLADRLSLHFRVLVPEQRGRGRSEWDSQPDRYGIPTYVNDMFELLEAVGEDHVAAVGTSMGGLMAMVMNAMRPGVFTHVVLNDIGPELSKEGLDRISGYVGQGGIISTWEEAVAYNRAINAVAFPSLSDQQWRDFTRQLFGERNGAPFLDYDPAISQAVRSDEGSALPPDLWSVYAQLESQPLMLIRGAISDLLDADIKDRMIQSVPDLLYLEVADVGHAPMLIDDAVTEALENFLLT